MIAIGLSIFGNFRASRQTLLFVDRHHNNPDHRNEDARLGAYIGGVEVGHEYDIHTVGNAQATTLPPEELNSQVNSTDPVARLNSQPGTPPTSIWL
ncbi:hypothetical protein [Spirosoma pulveris]